MTEERCILCGNTGLVEISTLEVSALARLYEKMLRQSVLDEFGGAEILSYVRCTKCDLRYFTPIVVGSPSFYAKMSRGSDNYYLTQKAEYQTAASLIAESDRVLDVGSGAGHFKNYIKAAYTGLDPNPLAVAEAKRARINVISQRLEEHLKTNAGKYSVVTCFQVLEHVSLPGAFLASCMRALAPGGRLVVSVPSEDSFVSLQENAALNMPPHHITRWTDKCLRNVCRMFDLRFEALEHEELSERHLAAFVQCYSMKIVREVLGCRSDELVEVSVRKRMVGRCARCIAPLVRKIVTRYPAFPRGHSVTLLCRKGN